jgi:DMSO reductase anchor subunit
LIWLLPVLSVSGFVIVPVIAAISVAAGAPIALLGIVFILVGPLISVILYYNLHNTIGKDIKRILAERPESELALS